MGSDGYRLAAESTCTDGVILEVGSGESTRFLALMGPRVFTIDLDPTLHAGLEHARLTFCVGRAEELLTRWHEPLVGDSALVCFAWLDGYDWPYENLPPDVLGRKAAEYEQRGLELSKEASQRSHLAIVRLLAPWMAAGGVVAFDDTWQVGGGWDGKGGTAVPWLLGFADRDGPRFELWRTQDDLDPSRHNAYVAVRRTR